MDCRWSWLLWRYYLFKVDSNDRWCAAGHDTRQQLQVFSAVEQLIISIKISIQTDCKTCAPVDPGKDEVRLNIG